MHILFFVIIYPLSMSISRLIFLMSLISAVNTQYNVPFLTSRLKRSALDGMKTVLFFSLQAVISGPKQSIFQPRRHQRTADWPVFLTLCASDWSQICSSVHVKSLDVKEKLSGCCRTVLKFSSSWKPPQPKRQSERCDRSATRLALGWQAGLQQPANICFCWFCSWTNSKECLSLLVCVFGLWDGSWTWLLPFYTITFLF